MGALERLASFTICTICDNKVSAPTFSASIKKDLFPLMVPATTASPFFLSTGIGSPVNIDSSIVLSPSVIFPSTGILSPGFTRNKSPFLIASIAMTLSVPFSTKMASVGANFNNSLMAPLVRLWALASNNCPNKTSVKITVVASKYKCTVPISVLNSAGKKSGNNKPNTLNKKATPAPIPISVNIFKFQLIIDFQARSKNIQLA